MLGQQQKHTGVTLVVQAAMHAVHELGSLGGGTVMEIKEVLSMLLSPVVRRAVVKHVAASCDGGEGVAPALQGVDGALRGGENVMLTLQWNHGHAQDGEVRPLACRPTSTSVNERENLSSFVSFALCGRIFFGPPTCRCPRAGVATSASVRPCRPCPSPPCFAYHASRRRPSLQTRPRVCSAVTGRGGGGDHSGEPSAEASVAAITRLLNELSRNSDRFRRCDARGRGDGLFPARVSQL